MGIAEYVARVLPLTMGGTPEGPAAIPAYRLPFLKEADPSQALATMVQNTTQTYNIQNPYVGDPVHAYDTKA